METVETTRPAPLSETPDRYGAYPRLDDAQIQALAEQGERRRTLPGDVLYREGDTHYDFVVILEGLVAVLEGCGSEEERVLGAHGPRRFMGELDLLTGEAAFVTA
ncbi:MAG TPA: cyclic nucleotide-binding domain-containing protein, partial [Actinomycetota bacterium]|nr:cyclic nucleotide-binding domain-containing protein [Actinomycetota bacterium]